MRVALAKSEPWIDRNAPFIDSPGLRVLHPLRQKLCDLLGYVTIVRRLLHRGGCALHMHQHDAAVMFRNCLSRAGLLQRTNVIDDRSAGRQSGAHHLGLAGVNRQWNYRTRQRL